jgi:replicative superfamily II helicase
MNIKQFKVNLVDEGDRGATLETIISRMKIIPKFVNIIS